MSLAFIEHRLLAHTGEITAQELRLTLDINCLSEEMKHNGGYVDQEQMNRNTEYKTYSVLFAK